MNYLIVITMIFFVAFLVTLFNFPAFLNISYFYLTWGVVLLLIPFLLYMGKHPKVVPRFFLAGMYFFYLHFIYEIVGLKLGLWTFPGKEFAGWVSIFGVSFPIEELFFWFILLALSVIAVYEHFDDER